MDELNEFDDEISGEIDKIDDRPASLGKSLEFSLLNSPSEERLSGVPVVSDSPKKNSSFAAQPVRVDDAFESRDDFLIAYDTYAAHEQYGRRKSKTNERKCYLKCPVKGCSFSLNANQRVNGTWIVTKSIAHHCRFDQRQKASTGMQVALGKKLIESIAREEMVENKQLMPSDLVRTLKTRFKFGNLLTTDTQLSKRIARALQFVRKELLDGAITQFKRLRSYLEMVQSQLGAYKRIEYDRESGKFQRLFLMLHATRDCLPNLRRVLGLDGAHLKNPAWNGVLLLLTAKDSENQIIPLCVAVVESENSASWTFFLRCLRDACPFLVENEKSFLTVSDFDKGIWGSLSEVFPGFARTRDIVHMAGNIVEECPGLSKADICEDLLELATCRTAEEWEKKFAAFLGRHFRHAKYLRGFIKPEQFSDFKFPNHRRYGRFSSQFAESANKMIMDVRTAPGIVDMVDCYLTVLTKTFAARKAAAEQRLEASGERALRDHEASKHHGNGSVAVEHITAVARQYCLSSFAEKEIAQRSKSAQKMQVTLTNATGKSTVLNVESGKRVTVELQQHFCSDQKWLREGIPCSHAIAAMLADDKSVNSSLDCLSSVWTLYAAVDPIWRASTQLAVYAGENVNMVGKEGLQEDGLKPPEAERRMRGRPRTKRIPSTGEKKRKQCSNCLRFGHNARSCTMPKLNEKSKLVGDRLTLPPALPAKKPKTAALSSTSPVSTRSISTSLLDEMDGICLRCGNTVPNRDFTDCKKCLRWIHGHCLPPAENTDDGRKRFVCLHCKNRLPTGEEEYPCADCSLECIDKVVMCDNEQCGSSTHLICAGFEETVDLSDVKFVCKLCLARSNQQRQSANTANDSSSQHCIIGCRNAGNTCYFNCMIAVLQAFPMTVMSRIARENRFLEDIANEIIEHEVKAVKVDDVLACVREASYARRFPFKQEHDAGEALLHVLEKTESTAMLSDELQFTERKTYKCSECSLVSFSLGDSSADGRTTSLRQSKPMSGLIKYLYLPITGVHSRLSTVSLQELIWLNLGHDSVDDLRCGSARCKEARVPHSLLTEVVDMPHYFAISIRREIVTKEPVADGSQVTTTSYTKNLLKLEDNLYSGKSVVFSAEHNAARYQAVAVGYHKGHHVNRGHWWSHVKHPVSGNWWYVGDGNSTERKVLPRRSIQPETTVALLLLKKCDGSHENDTSSFAPTDNRRELLLRHWNKKY